MLFTARVLYIARALFIVTTKVLDYIKDIVHNKDTLFIPANCRYDAIEFVRSASLKNCVF